MATIMSTPLPTSKINDNSMDLTLYRGDVIVCPFCPPIADAMTTRRACTHCLGHQFIAKCLNCHATGQYSGRTVWDGGRNEHTSTCGPCGGKGFFPSKGPATAVVVAAPSVVVPPLVPPVDITAASGLPPAVNPADKTGEASMAKDAPDGTHVIEKQTDTVT